MTDLLGINRNNEHFIAYNPHETEKSTGPNETDYYKIPAKTFAVGTNVSGGDPVLATAKFRELHIGGGLSNGGLTITESGDIQTSATLPGSTQTQTGSRLAPASRTSGSSYNVVSDNIYYTPGHIGKIVVSTNDYRNTDSISQNAINNITYNESLPVVTLSTQVNDKRVFGVITGKENDRLNVQSSGSGKIKVCDCNGSLNYGDYITTSSMQGIGMKQSEDYITNATVAKVLKSTNFQNPKYVQQNGTEITRDQYNLLKGDNHKVAKMVVVECVFVCGA